MGGGRHRSIQIRALDLTQHRVGLIAAGVDGHFGKCVFRFPDNNLGQSQVVAFDRGDQRRSDFVQQIPGHIFGSRVVGQAVDLVGANLLQCTKCIFIRIPDDKTMVPMVVNPAFKKFVDHTKINDPTKFVDFVAGDEKLDQIVVAVKISTFAFVTQKAMPGTEFDLPHYRDTHDRLFQKWIVAETRHSPNSAVVIEVWGFSCAGPDPGWSSSLDFCLELSPSRHLFDWPGKLSQTKRRQVRLPWMIPDPSL